MTVVTSASPVTYDLNTVGGAHALMVALNGYLTAVGLTQATLGTDYDPAGTSSQIPTARYATSSWMAYNFADAAQATFPITVWFRIIFGNAYEANAAPSATYMLQYRVSEGFSGTSPLGGNLECFSGDSVGGGNNYLAGYSGSVGDFVRYSGNALTVIMAGNGGYVAPLGAYNSALEIHIERRYDAVTGTLSAGFVGLVPSTDFYASPPAQYVAGGVPNTSNSAIGRSSVSVSSGVPSNKFLIDPHTRSLNTLLLTAAGSAIVAPIFVIDQSGRPATFLKVFTAPIASFTRNTTAMLDFTGTPTKYLVFQPYSNALKGTVLTYLFEWE